MMRIDNKPYKHSLFLVKDKRALSDTTVRFLVFLQNYLAPNDAL